MTKARNAAFMRLLKESPGLSSDELSAQVKQMTEDGTLIGYAA